GPQRDVVGGRFDPGAWLSVADDLPDLVNALRTYRRTQSVAGHRAGMGDRFAAAHRELRQDAGGNLGAVRLLQPAGSWVRSGRRIAFSGARRRLIAIVALAS